MSASAQVALDVRVGETETITLDATFAFGLYDLTMAQLALMVAPASIADLLGLIIEWTGGSNAA